MINLTINNQKHLFDHEITVFEALNSLSIELPTFCYDERFKNKLGICGLCAVLINGTITKSCKTPISDGMVIFTDDPQVFTHRKELLQKYIDNHYVNCLVCEKSGVCKLQKYCFEYGIDKTIPNAPASILEDQSNPFYYINPNKCVACGKCAQICRELQCNHALKLKSTDGKIHSCANNAPDINSSTCVFCGNCVSFCPVGALLPKYKYKFRNWETKKVKTTCAYCGVGCQITFEVKDNKIVQAQPELCEPNKGLLCVKGKFGFEYVNSPERLTTPLIKTDSGFRKASWDEALDLIVSKLKSTIEQYTPLGVGALSSGKCTNEENYLFQKFFKGVVKTNNLDHCSRLCHSSSSTALSETLGIGAMSNGIDESVNSKVILISGENIRENHPVLGAKIKHAVQNGAKLIIIDVRDIDLSEKADVFLQIKPGTDIALINAMANVIISENLYNNDFLLEKVTGFEEFKNCVLQFTPEISAKICGVSSDDIIKAARIYASDIAAIYIGMGNTQHRNGTDNVIALSNLALICGNIGKLNGGINPLRGQNNAQGACDMGAFPDIFSGYQKINDLENRKKMEEYWGVEGISPFEGLSVVEMVNKMDSEELKYLYVMGENPLISDPNLNHTIEAFKKLDFLVVQDIFLTETAKIADVVLPATSFVEKEGTFTNTGRRVQRVRKVLDPPGEAKMDLDIILALMEKMGYEQKNKTPESIMAEIEKITPLYNGYNYELIENEGVQWPVKNGKGTPFLYENEPLNKKFKLIAVEPINSLEIIDEEYPYYLTTGRVLYQYHTRTMSGKVDALNEKYPEALAEMNSKLIKEINKKDGDYITIQSRRGEINVKIKLREGIKDNVIFVPFHFSNVLVNKLIDSKFIEPKSKTPEYKICPVRIF